MPASSPDRGGSPSRRCDRARPVRGPRTPAAHRTLPVKAFPRLHPPLPKGYGSAFLFGHRMIRETFIHIAGGGYRIEERIRRWGIRTWAEFLAGPRPPPLRPPPEGVPADGPGPDPHGRTPSPSASGLFRRPEVDRGRDGDLPQRRDVRVAGVRCNRLVACLSGGR